MDKIRLNWTEVQFSENIENIFEVLITSWVEDIKDGNFSLIPGSLKEAKEVVYKASREWMAIAPYGRRTEWEVYCGAPRVAFALVRDDVMEELVDELFIGKDEVIEISMRMNWM